MADIISLSFIEQHIRRNDVDEFFRRDTDHQHGFVFPQMHNRALDNFARLHSATNGRVLVFISGLFFLVTYCAPTYTTNKVTSPLPSRTAPATTNFPEDCADRPRCPRFGFVSVKSPNAEHWWSPYANLGKLLKNDCDSVERRRERNSSGESKSGIGQK